MPSVRRAKRVTAAVRAVELPPSLATSVPSSSLWLALLVPTQPESETRLRYGSHVLDRQRWRFAV